MVEKSKRVTIEISTDTYDKLSGVKAESSLMVCEFAFNADGTVHCPNYYATSYTCNDSPRLFGGRWFCGKARQLALEKQDLNAKVEQEMLYKHTGRCHY